MESGLTSVKASKIRFNLMTRSARFTPESRLRIPEVWPAQQDECHSLAVEGSPKHLERGSFKLHTQPRGNSSRTPWP
jgi:hypothetical protein